MTLTLTLKQKLDQARFVIEEAFDVHPADTTVIAWSGGKDSTLLLKLTLDVCQARGILPPKVLDIDQGDAFDEIITFRTKLVAEWGLELIIVRNSDVLNKVSCIGDRIDIARLDPLNQEALQAMGHDEDVLAWVPSSAVCNHLMKAVPVQDYLRRQSMQAMFTGIRWDEHTARASEAFFSPREHPPHTRVHPILHLSEREVWDATFGLGIPFNDLYAQGYRSVDTRSGTKKTSSLPAWEQDLEHTHERGGRGSEKEAMMAQLRALGYM